MSAPKQAKPQNQPSESTDIERRSELADMVPEIMGGGSHFDEDALRSLSTFDEAIALATSQHGEMLDASDELGDGFTLLGRDQKNLLENRPLLLLEWAFRPGDFGTPFVSVRVAARNDNGSVGKYIINDGSTGIAEQLAKFTKKTGKLGNLLVKGGLRKSEYDKELPDGKGGTYTTHATTWYLNV